MSMFIKLQYAPPTNTPNQFMGILPNMYNPGRPLPVTLHLYQIMRMYDLLHLSATECDQMMARMEDDEDRDLYGGSMNPVAPDQ